jgi:hypothetical protein
MALRPSIALRNFMMEGGSFKHAMSNCFLKLYTGAQPSTAEAAPTGTLLVTYSDAGGTPTRETLAQGEVQLTGGASGSVDTITLDGNEIMGSATAFNSSLAQTAQDCADKINLNPANYLVTASVSGDNIRLTAKPGLGAVANGMVVASTVTTITKADVNLGTTTAGVTAVNGLLWGDSAANVIVKDSTQTWQGTAAAGGTAGWFRIEAAVSDAGGVDSTESIFRIDGSVATSGAELNLGSTTIALSSVQTISSFSITFPTA